MEAAVTHFGDSIWRSSREYAIISGSIEQTKKFSALTTMTYLRKSLESDEVIYLEGSPTRFFIGDKGFEHLAENKQTLVNRDFKIALG